LCTAQLQKLDLVITLITVVTASVPVATIISTRLIHRLSSVWSSYDEGKYEKNTRRQGKSSYTRASLTIPFFTKHIKLYQQPYLTFYSLLLKMEYLDKKKTACLHFSTVIKDHKQHNFARVT